MELIVGSAYANRLECFAREIIAIEEGQVSYRDFLLDEGRLISPWQRCKRSTFRNWAKRLCTQAEVSRFDREDVVRQDQARAALVMTLSTRFGFSFQMLPSQTCSDC
jgi:hypothetical protein